MTNSYDVDHGLSQDAPGPLEPVEIAQQPGAAPATGNTARDQEMYAAGIRTGEENAKHNAAIRGGASWQPVESAPMDGRRVLLWNERYNAAITGQFYGLGGWKLDGEMPPLFHQPTHWMPLPAPPCPTCNDQGAVGNILTAQPCPDCAAPGVSTVEDERQAFEAWAKRKKMPLARIGQQYDDFWVDHAWNGWQARAALDAPAAGDALDAARWRAYAKLFPEISASFLATHGVDGGDPLPTIKGAAITGGYVVVTPAGWDADKAVKLRDAILRIFPVNPVHTPRPSDELAAQRKGDA